MSNVPIKDSNNTEVIIDTFERIEGSQTIQTQAVVNIDPNTGLPNTSTEATLLALKQVADNLLIASNSIKSVLDSVNTSVNLSGTTLAALESITVTDGATEATLSTVNTGVLAVQTATENLLTISNAIKDSLDTINTSVTVDNFTDNGLTNNQLRASALEVSDTTLSTINNSIVELTETILSLLNLQLSRSPNLNDAGAILADISKSTLSTVSTISRVTDIGSTNNVVGTDPGRIAYTLQQMNAAQMYNYIEVT